MNRYLNELIIFFFKIVLYCTRLLGKAMLYSAFICDKNPKMRYVFGFFETIFIVYPLRINSMIRANISKINHNDPLYNIV